MSESNHSKNKRIVKNTLMLYVRMIFTMVVSLFTSRVFLQTLGVDDYGIYNVVGGVVAMFSLFSSSLSAAISRFITYELGKNDIKKLSDIFSTSINILIVLSVVLAIVIEVAGVWFLNAKMNIPAERMVAANWVMQCSIIVFVINLISVPYNAAIIAHEKMDVYAYISILDVVFKLLVIYVLYISPIDKLISYAILLVIVQLIIRVIYGVYCERKFEECKFRWVYDKTLFKQMGSFAGWNLFGSGAYLFNTQGVNIVTNLFFGVAVNAARGVAGQAEAAVRMFVTNFTTAMNPQITKSYAEGNYDYMQTLVCRGAKFSYLLMFIFVVPFIYEADKILEIWLGVAPESAALFLKLSMIGTLFDILGNSTAHAAWATGNIKRYYKYVAALGCLVFPISYVAFLAGMPAYTSYVAFIVIYLVLIFVKLYIIKGLMNFPTEKYFREVIFRLLPVSILSFFPPGIVYFTMEEGWVRLIVLNLVSMMGTSLFIYLTALEKSERQMLHAAIQKVFKLKKN